MIRHHFLNQEEAMGIGAAWMTSTTWPGMLIWPTLGGVKTLPVSVMAASTAAAESNSTATTESDIRKENGWCNPAFANSTAMSDKLDVGGTLHTWTKYVPWLSSSKLWSASGPSVLTSSDGDSSIMTAQAKAAHCIPTKRTTRNAASLEPNCWAQDLCVYR